MRAFNLIQFQDRVIQALDEIEINGVGRHKARSRGAVLRRAEAELVDVGYPRESIRDALDACRKMAELERVSRHGRYDDCDQEQECHVGRYDEERSA